MRLHSLWDLVFEKGSYPVCFSVGFVLLIGILPDVCNAKFGVTFIPQTGTGKKGTTASVSMEEDMLQAFSHGRMGLGATGTPTQALA